MSIITLTSDLGNKDHSVAAIKGAIYNELPEVRIVDISHNVSPFDIQEGAYIINAAYRFFPKNSVHIIGIDSEWTPENRHIVVKVNEHYFVCSDNGIVSLITNNTTPDFIYEVPFEATENLCFAEAEIFTKVACHIIKGKELSDISNPIKKIKELTTLNPVYIQPNRIIGSVIYIDNYGNVVTNITRSFFNEHLQGRKFVINARGVNFSEIHNSYSHAIDFTIKKTDREEDGKQIAIFNQSGYLELAIYKSDPNKYGAANTLFGLKCRDTINITFH